jgi:hypothetical protein
LKIYINGADVSAVGAETLTGTIMSNNSLWYLGDAFEGAGSTLAGYLDEVGIWNDDLSGANVTELESITGYPFN